MLANGVHNEAEIGYVLNRLALQHLELHRNTHSCGFM